MRKRINKTKVSSTDDDVRLSDVEFEAWVFRVTNKHKYSPRHHFNKSKNNN